jgi:hypothetical protein
MLVELIRGNCGDSKVCPALHRTDRGTVVVQGWAVSDAELLGRLDPPAGEEVVEVPAGLLAEVIDSWPAPLRTDHGTLIVPGTPVTDPDVLRQLSLPAGERAVEVPARLLTKVLQAC